MRWRIFSWLTAAMVNPLTTQQVQDAAKAQVDVGSETLIISNVYVRVLFLLANDTEIIDRPTHIALEERSAAIPYYSRGILRGYIARRSRSQPQADNQADQ